MFWSDRTTTYDYIFRLKEEQEQRIIVVTSIFIGHLWKVFVFSLCRVSRFCCPKVCQIIKTSLFNFQIFDKTLENWATKRNVKWIMYKNSYLIRLSLNQSIINEYMINLIMYIIIVNYTVIFIFLSPVQVTRYSKNYQLILIFLHHQLSHCLLIHCPLSKISL